MSNLKKNQGMNSLRGNTTASNNLEAMNSEELWKKLNELKSKVLKVKLLNLNESIGKLIKAIISLYDYRNSETARLFLFDNDKALLLDERQDCEYDFNTWICDSNYSTWGKEPHAWSGIRSEMRSILDAQYIDSNGKEHNEKIYDLVDEDILKEVLKVAVLYEEVKHAENIKEEIQRKLDEISKLKDQL